jgi:hypothetical protein
MPAFHLLRCMVNLGGDDSTIVYRDRSRPIVFPELPILQFLHGEEAITDVYVVGAWDAPNDEVLQRLQSIYAPETIEKVFPGARPRLPLSDASIPRCTQKVYKPRPVEPDSPDPKLRPLDQFTMPEDAPEGPVVPRETEPTPDEIAAHAQDEDEIEDDALGLGPQAGDQPRIVRDTSGRGSSRRAGAARVAATLPDVNAGGSHAPGFEDYTSKVVPRDG